MENHELFIIITFVAIWVILNAIATFIVLNTHFEVKNRRVMQILFVWLLPYIGALLAIFINKEDYFEERRQKKIGNNPNISNNEASDMAMTLSRHDHDHD